MRICYLLDSPELGGGVKVVFQHAQLLCRQGHRVTILGMGPRPGWISFDGVYLDYSTGPADPGSQDLVIATFWTTLPQAERLGLGPVVHFCQGYEGDLVHLAAVRPQIEAAYERRLPTWVTTPYLEKMVRDRFGRDAHIVPPPLDPIFGSAIRFGPRRVPRILISGIFEAEVKGIPTALQAVNRLRQLGQPCRVVRVSVLPLSDMERGLLKPDLFLHAVSPGAVAKELRSCDLVLFSSLAFEGFGLPLLEAMSAGIPAVASRIPSTEFMGGELLNLVPVGDAAAFAERALELLRNPRLWRQARRRGFQAAQRFHPRRVARDLREAVLWATQRSSQQPG